MSRRALKKTPARDRSDPTGARPTSTLAGSVSSPLPGLCFVLLGVVLIAGVAAYANSLQGPFIFDDTHSIPDNYLLRVLWPTTSSWWAPPQSTLAGRPVVAFTLALNYAVGGLDVRGYHLVNIALHLVSTLLLFGILRRTFLTPPLTDRWGRSAPWLALVGAAFWLLHPLQTESVTYIIQRTELLMALFYLLTLYGAIRAWGATSPWQRMGWSFLAITACALGMGSKEVMVSAPLMVLLYDYTFISRSWKSSLQGHRYLYLGLAATWLILGGLLIGSPRSETVGWDLGIRPPNYLATQAGVLLWYLRLCVWPHPLVITYDDWPIASLGQALLPGLFILALLLATGWWLYRRSPWGFLGAWFFLILAPTSSVVPIVSEMAAERRMYLPLAAILVGLLVGTHQFLTGLYRRRQITPALRTLISATLAIGLSLVMIQVTRARNNDYRTTQSIWEDALIKKPRSMIAHNSMGLTLAAQGILDQAIAHYSEALRLNPVYYDAHSNLGIVLARQGRFDEAITHYREALRLNPSYGIAHNNLGAALADQGRLDEAIVHYLEALRFKPAYPDAHYNLAKALDLRGRISEAIQHYQEALRLHPEWPQAHNNLGVTLERLGRVQEALQHYAAAAQQEPPLAEAHANLGRILAQAGQTKEAIKQLADSLRINPGLAPPHVWLGNLLAEQGRRDEAIAHYRQALQLDPNQAEAHKQLQALLHRPTR